MPVKFRAAAQADRAAIFALLHLASFGGMAAEALGVLPAVLAAPAVDFMAARFNRLVAVSPHVDHLRANRNAELDVATVAMDIVDTTESSAVSAIA